MASTWLPPTILTTSMLRLLRSSATICWGLPVARGLFTSASTVLMAPASGSSCSELSTRMDRAASGFTIARSSLSMGLPVRQMIRTLPGLRTRARMASSISTLSCSASTTMRGLDACWLASMSWSMMVNTLGDHPRIRW